MDDSFHLFYEGSRDEEKGNGNDFGIVTDCNICDRAAEWADSGYTINNQNKARVIVGLALHVSMDTYSHRAYKKDSSGNWTVRITKYQDANNNGKPDDDDIAYIPERYTCAKKVAFDIIDVWHYALTPDAIEFYQDAHNKSKFHLGKFGKYVKKADPSTNEAHPNWYYNRTNDE